MNSIIAEKIQFVRKTMRSVHMSRFRMMLLSAFLLMFLSAAVWAQDAQLSDVPSENAEYNFSIWEAAAGLSGGSNVRFPQELPSYMLLNPAVFNPLGVPVVEAGYSGIIEGAGNGYSGHRASLWSNIPIASGQINSGFEFQSLATTLANTGSAARLHAGWSNSFRDSFLLGAGLETGLSQGRNGTDWTLSAKLGVSQNLGTVGPFDTFKWNAAFTNLGKEMTTPGGAFYRSPFTLRGGVHGQIVLNDNFTLSNGVLLAFPGMRDFMFNLQSSLEFRERLALSLSWGLDIGQQVNDQYQNSSLLPRVSLSYSMFNRAHPDLDINTSLYSPYSGHTAFSVGAAMPLKRVDRDGPEISLEMPEQIFISPNNDGRQDNWDQALEVEDPSGVSRMEIHLKSGSETLFTQSWEIEPVAEEGLYGLVKEVLQGSRTAVIPESVLISGKNDSGDVLPDGTYQFSITATDVLGNRSELNPAEVVIDTMQPEIEIADLSVQDKIFSPNNDGNKDELLIPQQGSKEQLWDQTIYDATGNPVWTNQIRESSLDQLSWDGFSDQGNRLPDGVYRYEVVSRDRAGNENRAEVNNIIINSVVSPVRIDLADSYFSPNGDGVKDSLTLLPIPESREGIRSWSIQILDDREEQVTTLNGEGAPSARVEFDGRSTDGEVLPQGRYRARFILEYFSGNTPRALSPWFNLDVTAPEISLELESDLFSPNNDNRSDVLTIYQESSEEQLWEARIVEAEDNAPVKEYSFRGRADFELTWDGRDSDGALAPDGTYRYIIQSRDRAGNSVEASSPVFTLDTSDAEVLVNAGYDAFSPNGDGNKDVQEFTTRVSNNDQVESYRFTIENVDGEQLRSISGTGEVPENISWDGRDDQGRPVEDNLYIAKLEVELRNRSVGSAQTRSFQLDTVYPEISLDSDYLIFSPNGDENKDSLTIRQRSTPEELFEARILNAEGEAVRSYFWEGSIENLTWDGLDEFGNLAPNGEYSYEIRVEDPAGNVALERIEGIELDSRNTSVFLTLSENGISPNGDGFKDSLEIGLYTNITEGIDTWALAIFGEGGNLIAEYGGNSLSEQEEISFDGRNEDGEIVEGQMYAQFSVLYTKGDNPQAKSSLFRVDNSGPDQTVRVNPVPFSPDGDGIADVLTIDIDAEDPAGIAGWRLGIYDRVGNLFKEFSSNGAPEEDILWDGLSDDGERVISAEDYRYEFESIDRLGNESSSEGLIPIDILVIKDGNNYKVAISNITFEPNSPRIIVGGPTAVGQRNESIIERLIEVFSKYPQYRIVIEGHANNISGTEREEVEELQPLSTGRAQAVKDQLVERGMDPTRIDVVGRGGTMPLVPFSDEENRWKNRRVEFILIR
ncbi:gliding motility-associated C-terminal domain-containing protein [Salinispira pacifica]|uniref:OmpA-like domain-containing protein n=1 Tax=Salinispira pacifica TaxID=1307761 RepID=V5WHQ0_9SPIO|nr:gliding motility-associated C-terminal domain-containing protein [Salinispira pacifica]AHC15145.1 hypothetical protein L21SP2_1768 [Salinispira pacifica]